MRQVSLLLFSLLPATVPYLTIGTGLLLFRNAWIAILSYHIGIAIIVLLSRSNCFPVQNIFHSKYLKLPVISMLIGAGSGILLLVLWPLLSVPEDINSYLIAIGLTDRTWPFFLAYFITVNPLLEEYYWRGYLGSSVKRLTLNDFLFSGYHIVVLAGRVEAIWLLAVFIVVTIGAWFWRQFDRIGEGLLPSIVSHVASDITIISVIYLMTRL